MDIRNWNDLIYFTMTFSYSQSHSKNGGYLLNESNLFLDLLWKQQKNGNECKKCAYMCGAYYAFPSINYVYCNGELLITISDAFSVNFNFIFSNKTCLLFLHFNAICFDLWFARVAAKQHQTTWPFQITYLLRQLCFAFEREKKQNTN